MPGLSNSLIALLGRASTVTAAWDFTGGLNRGGSPVLADADRASNGGQIAELDQPGTVSAQWTFTDAPDFSSVTPTIKHFQHTDGKKNIRIKSGDTTERLDVRDKNNNTLIFAATDLNKLSFFGSRVWNVQFWENKQNKNETLPTSYAQAMPGGAVIQWGQIDVDGNGLASITFPTAFSSSTSYAFTAIMKNDDTTADDIITLGEFSNTGVDINGSTGNVRVHWQAIGF